MGGRRAPAPCLQVQYKVYWPVLPPFGFSEFLFREVDWAARLYCLRGTGVMVIVN